jgi:hypothetical protein
VIQIRSDLEGGDAGYDDVEAQPWPLAWCGGDSQIVNAAFYYNGNLVAVHTFSCGDEVSGKRKEKKKGKLNKDCNCRRISFPWSLLNLNWKNSSRPKKRTETTV